MSIRRFSLFCVLICLPSLLAAQTNVLLAIHLANCCAHRTTGEGPETPVDHQKHCPDCRFLLNVADKTIVEFTAPALHVETDTGEKTLSIHSFACQIDPPCPSGRGPPCV